MKIKSSWSLAVALAAALGVTCVTNSSHAASFTYDADNSTPTSAQDGAGLGWDTSTANWFNGTTDVVWSNSLADTAVFGAAPAGTGGTVTVGTVNVGTIQFNQQTTTGYTLATGTITLGTGITTTSTVNSIISAKISGTNGLAFNGVAGAGNGLSLTGANDYTGITTLSTGGRLTTTGATALGSSAGATATDLGTNYTLVNTGATVGVGTSTSEAFVINGGGSNSSGALRPVNGVTLSSLIQLGSNSTIASNFGTITLSGNVDLATRTLSVGNGSNAVSINASGLITSTTGGSIAINDGFGSANGINLTNNSNSYFGTTTVSQRSFVGLGGDTVLGSSTLVLAGGTLGATVRSTDSTARTIANAVSITGDAIFGQTTVQTGALNFTSTAASSLGTTARTLTTNVDTTLAAAFSNSADITKAGVATLTLTGASTRTGATTVSAGVLALNGANAQLGSSGAVSVLTTAVSLTISTGVLNGIGDTASVTLAGGGTPNVADVGFANLGLGVQETIGGLTLGATAQGAGRYGSTAAQALLGNLTFVSDEYFSGQGVFIVVPEPSTLVSLLGGFGMLAGLQRFRRRSA